MKNLFPFIICWLFFSSLTLAQTIIFQDDFEDGVLDGWSGDPSWNIENDNGNNVLHSWVSPSNLGSISIETEGGWNYIFETKIKLIEQDASIFYRSYFEHGGYGFYSINVSPNYLGLSKEINGNYQNLTGASVPLNMNEWYQVKIDGNENRIRIYVEGSLVIDYTDTDNPILFGGISSFENRGHTHFDDVTVSLAIPSSSEITWMQTGYPPGGGFWSISISPSDPQTIYIATRKSNLYSTINGGLSWEVKGARLGSHIFAPVAIHPINPDIIYTSNGVVNISTDGGATFQSQGIGSGESAGVQAIAIFPSNPELIYVGDDRGDIYKTVDGGDNWSNVGNIGLNYNVRMLLINPSNANIIYAGVAGAGVFKSTSGGVSWTQVSNLPLQDGSLVMNPTNPNSLYLAANDAVHKSIDGGNTWTQISTPFTDERIVLAVASSDSNILYAGTNDEIFKSNDGGYSWFLTNYSGFDLGPEPAIAVHPTDPNSVYAGNEQGMAKSSDGGNSWTAINDGIVELDIWKITFDPANPDTIYAGTWCMRGLFKSTNAGDDWKWLPEHFHYVMNIKMDPFNSRVIYLADHDGLFKSSDGGNSWTILNEPVFQDVHFHGLAIDPNNPNVVYAGTVGGPPWNSHQIPPFGTIYKSTDAGATWFEINDGYPSDSSSVHTIAIDPSNSNIIYLGTYKWDIFHNQGYGIGVFKSTDGGNSWIEKNQGLTTLNIHTLAIDPFNTSTVYAGTHIGLFKTTDGGELWSKINNGPVGLEVTSIAFHPSNSNIICVGTEQAGVFLSNDGGENWSIVNQGLTALDVGDLAFDATGGLIYAAVRGGGVFRGSYITTSIEEDSLIVSNVPQLYSLNQNYPNPFNSITRIHYQLPLASSVEFVIYNTLGQKIRTLVTIYQNAGFHYVQWNGRNDTGIQVSSGLYLYRLKAGNFMQTKKMLLMR